MRLLQCSIAAMAMLALASLTNPSSAQGAGAAAQSGSTAGAGAQAVVVQNGGNVPSTQTLRNTPNVSAPAVYASNPCAVGMSIGGSVAGFGVAGGETHADHGCELRSWYINMMQSASATHDPMYLRWAIGIACASDSTLRAVAPPGVCEPIKVSPAPAPATVAPSAPVAKVSPAPKFVHRTAADGAPAFCGFKSLAWQAYPECRKSTS